MKKILVCWSIAFDIIKTFPDEFSKFILADKLDEISVCFNVASKQVLAWWAGHNIAYNLALLGEKALLVWWVGKDFSTTQFNEKNIDYSYVATHPEHLTATANITSDSKWNQITTFYPWASVASNDVSIDAIKEACSIGIVSPDDPNAMLKHLKWCKERSIPVIFDPGQPLPAFSKQMLHEALEAATYVILNEYERDLLCQIAEIEEPDLLTYVDAYIITLAGKWSRFVSKEETLEVPAIPVQEVVDPTWAGDSYRAGILHALHHGNSRKEGMELWTKLAHACIQCTWTQIHKI